MGFVRRVAKRVEAFSKPPKTSLFPAPPPSPLQADLSASERESTRRCSLHPTPCGAQSVAPPSLQVAEHPASRNSLHRPQPAPHSARGLKRDHVVPKCRCSSREDTSHLPLVAWHQIRGPVNPSPCSPYNRVSILERLQPTGPSRPLAPWQPLGPWRLQHGRSQAVPGPGAALTSTPKPPEPSSLEQGERAPRNSAWTVRSANLPTIWRALPAHSTG